MKTKLVVLTFLTTIAISVSSQKSLVDFFLPMEPKTPLVSKGIWGDSNVLPRDTANGLEDVTLDKWCYWDGSIVKDDEGQYHMYASRWSQAYHHSTAWKVHSKGTHAVSDSWYGPFVDKGETWPYWMDGKGTNVIGLRMHDGRYALVGSEIIPGNIWTGDNPNGPFDYAGQIKLDFNGFHPGTARYNFAPNHMSNVMVLLRPDGRYMIVPRQCSSLISEDGILGPYKVMHGAAWSGIESLPQEYMEDPTVWYSDGLYHIVVNYHGGESDVSYHLTSRDGIHHWKNRGIALEKEKSIFKYFNGTINDWRMVQRPTVYVEDDTVRAFNFSVIDVHKGSDGANDNHGSKIVVVPFDGKAFGDAMREIVRKEDSIINATPLPEPWQSVDIGNNGGQSNYNAEDKVFKIRSIGKNIDGTSDDFRFAYQKMKGDFMITAQVMMQDNTNPFAKAGITIRKSLDADAINASMLISARKGANFQYRKNTGELTDSIHIDGSRAPYWLRILKTGNQLVAYVSSSHLLPFKAVGSTEINFTTDSLYVGLAVCSNSDSTNTTRFQEVEITPFAQHDMILSHNLPAEIPNTYPIKIEVEYLTSQERDVNILIRNVTNWDNGVGNVTKTVNGYGKTVLEFTPSKTINATDQYEWEMNLREKGQNWKTNIEGTQFKVRGYQAKPKNSLEKVQVSLKQLELTEGETKNMTASLQPADADEKEIIWLSEHPKIAQVDYVYGKIYALKEGQANIIALNPETGKSDTCNVTVKQNTTGSTDLQQIRVKIFPNPFNNELTIENSDMVYHSVQIYNLMGEMVLSERIADRKRITINTSMINNLGMYIIHLKGLDKCANYKILKH